jgi:hypothetical protein
LIRAPKAAADPSVSSDPTILSEATSGIVAYYIERPDYYAECVAFFTDEFYPSFRATLTWLVVAYTGTLIALLAGAGVFFGF